MPRAGKLFAGAVESSGSAFKEGWVRVDEACYRVHQNKGGEGQPQPAPMVAFIPKVTRLDEDLDELKDDGTGEAFTEELVFGLGGKSLLKMHPGTITSADDDDPEDEGSEVNAEGNTIYVREGVGADLLNKKSAYYKLLDSLKKLGEKDDLIDAHYADVWKGAIFYIHAVPDNDVMIKGNDGKERAVAYKVVKEVNKGLGQGGKKKGAKGAEKGGGGGGDDKPAKGGKSGAGAEPDEDTKLLLGVLKEIAADKEGESLSIKLLASAVSTKLDEQDVDVKRHTKLIASVRDAKWLATAKVKGMAVEENDGKITSVSFE